MNESTVGREVESALEALCRRDVSPLLGLLTQDVDFFVDWKGEGVFEGGPLHGRRGCEGREGVVQFFDRLFGIQEIVGVETQRTVELDGELLLVGQIRWRTRAEAREYGSDFTLRLVFDGAHVCKARFLTLPFGHLATFIPDYKTSVELSTEHVKRTIRDFQKLYFDGYLFGKTWGEMYWMGIPIFKCPSDMWVYQEMIYKQKPDLIIETGTCAGGSALYMASMCEMFGKGRVVTVDLVRHIAGQPPHDRITYLVGDSTSDEIVSQIRGMIPPGGKVMVVLDSDHRAPHVIKELRRYAPLVPVGCYIIVEDSNLNGHPTKPNYGPGPMEAIDEFLAENKDFVIDPDGEKFFVTFNPRGYLRRVRG
jgi:cephalosporin hydroxylase